MEWVAYKSPMPLQAQVFYIFLHMQWYSSRFQCSKRSLLKILIDHKSFHFPLASEKACLPAYSMVICCVTANITADILLP